jgi:hypothetical protein
MEETTQHRWSTARSFTNKSNCLGVVVLATELNTFAQPPGSDLTADRFALFKTSINNAPQLPVVPSKRDC